jgi:hypothetical protein
VITEDKHSGIPGSPRTYVERCINERIEMSKMFDYDWNSTATEEALI